MKFLRNKWVIAILALCLVVCAAAGIAYAKYLAELKSDADIDVTAEGILTVTVTPTGGAPGTYTVTNDEYSTVSAYVRVAVVVTWQNSGGDLWAVPPTEGTDYTIEDNALIQKLGDYYYYKGIRNPGESFTITVNQQPGSHAPSGFSMHVQVLAEGIQCLPASVAADAWGYRYQDGSWAATTP